MAPVRRCGRSGARQYAPARAADTPEDRRHQGCNSAAQPPTTPVRVERSRGSRPPGRRSRFGDTAGRDRRTWRSTHGPAALHRPSLARWGGWAPQPGRWRGSCRYHPNHRAWPAPWSALALQLLDKQLQLRQLLEPLPTSAVYAVPGSQDLQLKPLDQQPGLQQLRLALREQHLQGLGVAWADSSQRASAILSAVHSAYGPRAKDFSDTSEF